jgi:hypothetical protein
MPQLRPSWQLSVATAVLLCGVTLVARRVDRRWTATTAAFAQEFMIVMLLLALWQRVGAAVHTRVAGAMERGRAIDDLQHRLHLPSELAVQNLVLPHPLLVRAADTYYAYAHLNGTAVFLVWLWWRRRAAYARARATIILTTVACLLVQVVPVAPPRLLPDLGFVDTALEYGQSVYGDFGTGLANQLSAMPSVHVGWAVIVAWYVWRAGAAGWRWLGPAHLAATTFAVVATANHWWLDGLVAAAIVAVAVPSGEGLRRLVRVVRRRPAGRRTRSLISDRGYDGAGRPDLTPEVAAMDGEGAAVRRGA